MLLIGPPLRRYIQIYAEIISDTKCHYYILYKSWCNFYKKHRSKWDCARLFLSASFAHEDKLTGNVCDSWKFVFF